jgi:hypothetical protein
MKMQTQETRMQPFSVPNLISPFNKLRLNKASKSAISAHLSIDNNF